MDQFPGIGLPVVGGTLKGPFLWPAGIRPFHCTYDNAPSQVGNKTGEELELSVRGQKTIQEVFSSAP